MRRASLIIFVCVCAAFGGAWWMRAGAAAPRAAAAPAPPIPSPTRGIDEYGNIPFEDEKARLDNFAIELQNDPTAKDHVTCYGGRVGRAGAARRRCERAKRYLVGHRRIPAAQIVAVDGGYREDLTVTLWIVPEGATPVQPTPTVDPREVRFVRGRAKRRPRSR
ncbi:MAG: hypothetical protein ABR603_11010 [Pyrinomonadaceae bacterium]